MKRIAFAFLAVIMLHGVCSRNVIAASEAYQKAEQTYLSRLDTYRSSLSAYQTARQKYLDFRTLTAESAAVEAGKKYIVSAIDLVTGYLDLLIQRTNAAAGLDSSDKDYIVDLYRKDKSYYESQRQLATRATTVAQLRTITFDLNSYFKEETMSKIPLEKALITHSEYDLLLNQITASFESSKKMVEETQNVSEPTTQLLATWTQNTEEKLRQSNGLSATIGKNLTTLRSGDTSKDSSKDLFEKVNGDLKTLWQNLVNHTSSISEILRRLTSG